MMYNDFVSILLTLTYILPNLPSFYGLFIFGIKKPQDFPAVACVVNIRSSYSCGEAALPLPLGEVAEHCEAGEGFLYPLSQKS